MKTLSFLTLIYVLCLMTTMSGMEIVSVMLLLTLPFYLKKWGMPPIPNLIVPIFGFAIIVFLGIVLAPTGFDLKIYDVGRLRFFLVLFPVLYCVLWWTRNKSYWLRGSVIFSIAIAVYGTVQHFIPVDLFRPEGKKVILYAVQDEKIGPLVLGTFNHHLTFSNIFLFYGSLFLALGLFGRESSRMKALYTLMGSWILLLVLWTQSRVAWVAVSVVLICLASFKNKKWMGLSLMGVTLLFAIFFGVDSGFRRRLLGTITQDELFSVTPRVRLWKVQWEFFRESPWLGVGYNNNERRIPEVVARIFPEVPNVWHGHAHSTFLQLLSTTGILGMVAYLWIWVVAFRNSVLLIRASDPRSSALGKGFLAAFIGFHIQGLTQWNFGDAEVLHTLIFWWAFLSVETLRACGYNKKDSSSLH